MADAPDTDATRVRRGDAALVAQYIHDLSERHVSAREADTAGASGDESGGERAEGDGQG
jgi:hypothetical protein